MTRALLFLEKLGLNYKLGKNARNRWGYLAGKDEERLADLHDMFADPHIAGIICSRGGYGAARFTDKINFELIRNNPKVFWGLFRYYIFTYSHWTIGKFSNVPWTDA